MQEHDRDIVTLAGLVSQLAELLAHHAPDDETRALAVEATMFARVKVAQYQRADGRLPHEVRHD